MNTKEERQIKYEKWSKTRNNFAIVLFQKKVVVDGVFGERIFETREDAQEFLESQGFKRGSILA